MGFHLVISNPTKFFFKGPGSGGGTKAWPGEKGDNPFFNFGLFPAVLRSPVLTLKES